MAATSDELKQKVDAALAAAGWFGRARAARKLVEGFSDADLAALPNDSRVKLLRPLVKGYWQFKAERKARNRIYAHLELEGGFAKLQAEKARDFEIELRQNALFRAGVRRWPSMGEAEKVKPLQVAADLQARILDLHLPTVALYRHTHDEKGELYLRVAEGRPNTLDEISVFLNQGKDHATLEQCIATVIEGGFRRWEAELAFQFNRGTLKADDPCLTQAEIFALCLSEGGKIGNPDDPAWANAPHRRNAHLLATQLAARLARLPALPPALRRAPAA